MEQKPSIGRIVHYHPDEESGPSPAVITEVKSDGSTCHLFVMDIDGFYITKAPYADDPNPGYWNWPPRV